jgi:Domain of unknown function (DUF4260)
MTAMTTALPVSTGTAQPTATIGMTTGAVRTWLRLEGVAAFGAALALFGATGGNWLFIVPLLLLPDLSAAGFLAGPRVGTFTYNLAHNWVPGILTLVIGVWLASPAIILVAAILIAHVGMDRAVGYGLKLPGSFQDTHLGRMGRTKA